MKVKRLQNRVAESRVALPVTAVYAALVWLAAGLVGQGWWVQFACVVVATALMMELNNRNALIRIYSRMVSCSFMVMTTMANFLFPSVSTAVVAVCFIAFYLILFHAYQDKTATGLTFYAFLMIGIASVAFVHLLYFVPVLWLLLAVFFVALSKKTFFASLLGIVFPYWLIGGYCVYSGRTDELAAHFLRLAEFQPVADYATVTVQQAVTLAFITLLALTGTIHFLRNSSNDKIRIRDIYYTLMAMNVFILLFLVLQPQHYSELLPLLIINTAPLIAHFIALTHTKVTNVAFCVIAVIALLITMLNLWMPSLTF